MRFVLTSILSLSMLNLVVLPAASTEWWTCQVEWSSGGFTNGGGHTESEARANLEQNVANDRVYNTSRVVSTRCWRAASSPPPITPPSQPRPNPPSRPPVPPPQPSRPQPLPSASGNFVQNGFYQVNAAGAVWQLYTDSWNGAPMACGVASGEHLANLGGRGPVTALSDIGTGRTWTGTCRVADGFYQVNAAGAVWQLYTENGVLLACGISSGDHLARRGGANRVRTVPRGAEAGAQRRWIGTCPN